MHIGEFKAQFSLVLEWVQKGEMIKVVKGKSNKLVGFFSLKNMTVEKKEKRTLGQWQNEGCYITEDFNQTTAEEFDLNGI